MRLDIQKEAMSVFRDPAWYVKLGLGTLFGCLVVTSPIVTGYLFKTIRQASAEETETLPEYENYSGMWLEGLWVSLVFLMLVASPLFVVTAGVVGMGMTSIVGSSKALLGLTGLGALAAFLLLACFFAALAFMGPAMILRYSVHQTVGAIFDVSGLIEDIRRGPVDYLVIVAFPFVAGFILSIPVGIIAGMTMGIGGILGAVVPILLAYIQARMLGSYYRLYFT